MTDPLSRPGRVLGVRGLSSRMFRRPVTLLLSLSFVLLLTGVFLGAECPDAWYTRAIRAIVGIFR